MTAEARGLADPSASDHPPAVTRLRRAVCPALDRVLLGAYTLNEKEYVGTSALPPRSVWLLLRDLGYTVEPIAALKYLEDGRVEWLSITKRGWILGKRQIHVHLFAHESGGTSIYAHEEYNWTRHPVKHYRGVDYYRAMGVLLVLDDIDGSPIDLDGGIVADGGRDLPDFTFTSGASQDREPLPDGGSDSADPSESDDAEGSDDSPIFEGQVMGPGVMHSSEGSDGTTSDVSKRHWVTNDGLAWTITAAYIGIVAAAGRGMVDLDLVPPEVLMSFTAAFMITVIWAFGTDAVEAWRGGESGDSD